MNRTFLISDTHFSDSQIIKYEKRPFKDMQEMNSNLIDNWNSVIKKEDTVFHLGDFANPNLNEDEIKNIVNSLNGKIILIMGNHDFHFSKEKWEDLGIYQAIQYPIIFKDFFILSHYPLYINENMPYANIFGHVHNNPSYKDFSNQSYCVSVERIHYIPISFSKIKDTIINKINNNT